MNPPLTTETGLTTAYGAMLMGAITHQVFIALWQTGQTDPVTWRKYRRRSPSKRRGTEKWHRRYAMKPRRAVDG